MVSISSAFDPFGGPPSVRPPEPVGVQAPRDRAGGPPPPGASDFRLASATRATAFELDLTSVGGSSEIRERVFGGLADVFGAFLEENDLNPVLEDAIENVVDLLTAAEESDADFVGVQIRLASVEQFVGARDENGFAAARVSQFAVEIGVVTADRVEAQNVGLLDFSGQRLDLSVEQRRTGVVSGVYALEDGAPTEGREGQARLDAVREALDRLQAVNDALSAFQRGEEGALDRLESLFRGGGGALADAQEALGRFPRRETPDQVLIPGAGILNGDDEDTV